MTTPAEQTGGQQSSGLIQLWALLVLNADDLERQAAMLRQEAESWRCPERESGQVRCTRSRHSGDGDCRVSERDVPPGWPIYDRDASLTTG